MWPAPCSCTTGTRVMPAGAKMSMASMKAEPMMPKMVSTPLATNVSTKASLGVMRVMVNSWFLPGRSAGDVRSDPSTRALPLEVRVYN